MASINDRINTIQALALQASNGERLIGSDLCFREAFLSILYLVEDNVFTNNLQSQFNQDVVINRNLIVSGTTFLKSKQVVYDVGTMLSNLECVWRCCN
jgi:hypothetical protein